MAIVSRRSTRHAAIFSAAGSSDCMAQAPRLTAELTQHAEDADLGSRKFLREVCSGLIGVGLTQRVNHQAGCDLAVTAAKFLFLRHRHAARIKRDPDFAAGHRHVGQQRMERRLQSAFVRGRIEARRHRKGSAKAAISHRSAAHGAVHVEEHLGHDPFGHRCRIIETFEIGL